MAEFSNCPTCGRSKRECDDSAAHGTDGCCMTCDQLGRTANHTWRTTYDFTGGEG